MPAANALETLNALSDQWPIILINGAETKLRRASFEQWITAAATQKSMSTLENKIMPVKESNVGQLKPALFQPCYARYTEQVCLCNWIQQIVLAEGL